MTSQRSSFHPFIHIQLLTYLLIIISGLFISIQSKFIYCVKFKGGQCIQCPTLMHLFQGKCFFDIKRCFKYQNGKDCIQCAAGFELAKTNDICIRVRNQQSEFGNKILVSQKFDLPHYGFSLLTKQQINNHSMFAKLKQQIFSIYPKIPILSLQFASLNFQANYYNVTTNNNQKIINTDETHRSKFTFCRAAFMIRDQQYLDVIAAISPPYIDHKMFQNQAHNFSRNLLILKESIQSRYSNQYSMLRFNYDPNFPYIKDIFNKLDIEILDIFISKNYTQKKNNNMEAIIPNLSYRVVYFDINLGMLIYQTILKMQIGSYNNYYKSHINLIQFVIRDYSHIHKNLSIFSIQTRNGSGFTQLNFTYKQKDIGSLTYQYLFDIQDRPYKVIPRRIFDTNDISGKHKPISINSMIYPDLQFVSYTNLQEFVQLQVFKTMRNLQDTFIPEVGGADVFSVSTAENDDFFFYEIVYKSYTISQIRYHFSYALHKQSNKLWLTRYFNSFSKFRTRTIKKNYSREFALGQLDLLIRKIYQQYVLVDNLTRENGKLIQTQLLTYMYSEPGIPILRVSFKYYYPPELNKLYEYIQFRLQFSMGESMMGNIYTNGSNLTLSNHINQFPLDEVQSIRKIVYPREMYKPFSVNTTQIYGALDFYFLRNIFTDPQKNNAIFNNQSNNYSIDEVLESADRQGVYRVNLTFPGQYNVLYQIDSTKVQMPILMIKNITIKQSKSGISILNTNQTQQTMSNSAIPSNNVSNPTQNNSLNIAFLTKDNKNTSQSGIFVLQADGRN